LRDIGELLGMSPEGVRQLVRERDELVHTGTVRREVVRVLQTRTRTRTLPIEPSANDNVQPKAEWVRRKLHAGKLGGVNSLVHRAPLARTKLARNVPRIMNSVSGPRVGFRAQQRSRCGRR
jgi:hypothetical protein